MRAAERVFRFRQSKLSSLLAAAAPRCSGHGTLDIFRALTRQPRLLAVAAHAFQDDKMTRQILWPSCCTSNSFRQHLGQYEAPSLNRSTRPTGRAEVPTLEAIETPQRSQRSKPSIDQIRALDACSGINRLYFCYHYISLSTESAGGFAKSCSASHARPAAQSAQMPTRQEKARISPMTGYEMRL